MNYIKYLSVAWLATACELGAVEANQYDAERYYAVVRAEQRIGNVLIAPDASVFFYEWYRPFPWASQPIGGPADRLNRGIAWLYQVRLSERGASTSEYALMPNAGASYRLGSLSPDQKHLIFCRVNGDMTVDIGVVRLEDMHQYLYDVAPDGAKLDRAVWLSNDKFVYPATTETGDAPRLILANLTTGSTQVYKGTIRIATLRAFAPAPKVLLGDAKLLAISADGTVEVYQQSNADVLKLYVRRNSGEPEIVFENRRHD